MKKIINFRILFFCFICYALAIFFAKDILSGSIFHIIFFLILFGIIIFLSIKRKTLKNFLAISLAFIAGFCAFFIDYNNFNGNIYIGEQEVTGRISNVKNYYGYQRVLLTNVKISNKKEKNIIAIVGGSDLQIGDKIYFASEIETVKQFSLGEYNNYAYKQNAPYFLSISQDEITNSVKTNLKIKEKLKISIKDLLLENMPEDSANLAYGMLFGDKATLNKDISESFRISGIAHALAVSGLHVGFLVAIINYVLNKCKTKPWLRLFIVFVILISYCYLCDFSPSVIRATLMCLILLCAGALGRQYDILNSLSIAGFVLLIFRPLSVFDAGFQLSFMSVLSIALLNKPTQLLLKKLKFPKFLYQPLALTLCVQIGILPFIAKYYTSMSLLSVFTNLLCIPLFQLAFIMLIIFLTLSLMIPSLGVFLIPVHWVLSIIIKVAKFITSISSSIINLVAIDFSGIIAFYIGMFIVSGYVMLGKKSKTIICLCLFIFSLFYGVFLGLPKRYQDLNIMQIDSNSSQYSLILSQNKSYLIGDFKDVEQVYKFLKRARINKLDCLITTSEDEGGLINEVCNNYHVKNVVLYNHSFNDGNISINFIATRTKTNIIEVCTKEYVILYATEKIMQADAEIIEFNYPNINIFINWQEAQLVDNVDFKICENKLLVPWKSYTNLNNWAIKIKNGELKHLWNLN